MTYIKNNKLETLIILCFIFVLVVVGFFWNNEPRETQGGIGNNSVDVLGTKSGTTTVAVGFYGNFTATSTGTTFIGSDIDTVTYTVLIKTASSTPNGLFGWMILGSNDADCATTKQVPSAGVAVTEVNWFDADPTNSRASGRIAVTGTTNATGTSITLKDVNWNCLRFEANGSSTSAWVQLKTKSLAR